MISRRAFMGAAAGSLAEAQMKKIDTMTLEPLRDPKTQQVVEETERQIQERFFKFLQVESAKRLVLIQYVSNKKTEDCTAHQKGVRQAAEKAATSPNEILIVTVDVDQWPAIIKNGNWQPNSVPETRLCRYNHFKGSTMGVRPTEEICELLQAALRQFPSAASYNQRAALEAERVVDVPLAPAA